MIIISAPTPATATGSAVSGTHVVGADRRFEKTLLLTVLDTSVPVQPGTLNVQVGNGDPFGPAYFFLDSVATPFASALLDRNGALAQVRLPITNLTVGTHRISASKTTVNPGGGSTFEVLTAQPVFAALPAGQPPAAANTGNRWAFQAYDFSDLANVDTYVFTINPSTVSRSFGVITTTTQQVASTDGAVVTWEGAPVPQVWSWSGTVLEKADHDQLVRWSQTGQRVWLTDHFQRRYLVKMEGLTMTPVRDPQHPWHHEYQMSAVALSGVGIRT